MEIDACPVSASCAATKWSPKASSRSSCSFTGIHYITFLLAHRHLSCFSNCDVYSWSVVRSSLHHTRITWHLRFMRWKDDFYQQKLSIQSIACDIKLEAALHSVFYAEASKRPWIGYMPDSQPHHLIITSASGGWSYQLQISNISRQKTIDNTSKQVLL